MFATCINCHAPLGANEAIEHFPVGRRLAFDAAKGRLWVVCRACRQWNLSPLEERWEAIEEGERLFRDTRLRVSTDNIGLARLRDGTEVIRIGEPLRPEFAAWRYGERFTRRWYLNAPGAAAGTALAAASKFGITNFLFMVGMTPFALVAGAAALASYVRTRRVVLRLRLADGKRLAFTHAHVNTTRFVPDEDAAEGWHLRVRCPRPWSDSTDFDPSDEERVIRAPEAARVAARLLPRLNRTGGRKGTVAEAVEVLERYGDAQSVFRKASRYDIEARKKSRIGRFADVDEDDPELAATKASDLSRAPAPIRLAAEMAAHEEQERALIAGELDDLTDQWKEAEDVAAIADSLTLPPAVLAQLERLRLR